MINRAIGRFTDDWTNCVAKTGTHTHTHTHTNINENTHTKDLIYQSLVDFLPECETVHETRLVLSPGH